MLMEQVEIIHDQITEILENSLSVYKVDVTELKKLNPDVVVHSSTL